MYLFVYYFKCNNVPFTNGNNKVDLHNKDINKLLKNLSKRIYDTRNSVIHNKNNNNWKKYIIFKDDMALLRETILLQFISERIIENTAEEIIITK